MGEWQVALSDQAEADLEAIVRFLAIKSPSAAERIGLELVELLFNLHTLPHRGAPLKHRLDLRKLLHRHYLIIFRIDERDRRVVIIRLWDGRQDPTRLSLP